MTFEDLEERFGIKFYLNNGEPRPVDEWLDDLYLNFSGEQIWIIISTIIKNGDSLFKDILIHQQ